MHPQRVVFKMYRVPESAGNRKIGQVHWVFEKIHLFYTMNYRQQKIREYDCIVEIDEDKLEKIE